MTLADFHFLEYLIIVES